MSVKLIGIDIAKTVFQVCGVDAEGASLFNRRVGRAKLLETLARYPGVPVVMEGCGSAHYWARELEAQGHPVTLLPPRAVKPYTLRNKTDAADAAALCAAANDKRLHPVPVKTERQQAILSLHRSRELLVDTRTRLVNSLRALVAEFGVIAPQGRAGFTRLRAILAAPEAAKLPAEMRFPLDSLLEAWETVNDRIAALEKRMIDLARENAVARRLMTVPGIGPITATALVATVGDAKAFKSGRYMAAWMGLTPRENASGLKRRRGGISKQGNSYLRRLLTLGAQAWLRSDKNAKAGPDPWLAAMRKRRPVPVVAVALANKMARIAWAVITRDEPYRPRLATA